MTSFHRLRFLNWIHIEIPLSAFFLTSYKTYFSSAHLFLFRILLTRTKKENSSILISGNRMLDLFQVPLINLVNNE